MKNVIGIIAAATILTGLGLYGQSLVVTSPGSNEKLTIGKNIAVAWTKSGTMSDTVAIRLRRANAPESETAVWNLANSAPNNGSYGPVTIPASVPAGNYFIRVRATNPSVIGDSKAFSIAVATSPGGGIRAMTRPDLTNAKLAKPDLSQAELQTAATQITRIERLEPDQIGLRMDMADPGYEIKAIGQGLGSRGTPNTWEYDHTYLIAKDIDNGAVFHMNISEWNNDQIKFHVIDYMRAGYYDVYFEKSNGFVSNKVRLKANGKNPYIQSISPASVPSGVGHCNINLVGLDFNLAGTPRAVVLQDQNFNQTNLAVTFWSDRAIQARISPLPAAGTYYILIEYPATTPNGKGYSNRLPIEIR
jgi:Ser-Thr-rich glycosyl-phosphatidyl-inositol-anchored membrane family